MKYNKLTRWLHAAIALGVTLQLLLSLAMETPKPGRPFGGLEAAAFESHEVMGLFVSGVLLLHWLFLLSGHAGLGKEHLFPWFSRQRRDAMIDEIKQQWARRRLEDTQQPSAVAGATHGLGLLVTSIMAITGGVVYFRYGGKWRNVPHSGFRRGNPQLFFNIHVDLSGRSCGCWNGPSVAGASHGFRHV
jgi:uncharacterized membrane protein